MDILNLVDKLEELFSQGRSIPLTHNVILTDRIWILSIKCVSIR